MIQVPCLNIADASGGSHGLATQVGVVFTLLLIAAAVLAFCKRTKLPFTVILVLVGLGLGQLTTVGPAFLHPLGEYQISPDVILFVFLPTLIFESAFDLDARQLRKNLLPVMTLAVPGVLISTAVIGAIVAALTPIPLAPALLLGAILSATDPVAVISLFKQLGAPKRLTVLVEGESLFNDATAIVVAGILIEMARRGMSGTAAAFGLVEFFIVFLGGMVVGLALGWACGFLLSLVRRDALIEISLTTVLAYASFLLAENVLHVSGVMATMMAGIVMGGWGRTKISPSIAGSLHHFWHFLAYVANALIFLLVGLSANLGALGDLLPGAAAGSSMTGLAFLALVIGAMLVSRAVVIFGLVPIAGRLSEPVDIRYQSVMYWGGLRGAIALAIVLHLPDDFAVKPAFVAVVAGAVLFTLVVQGLTINTVVKRFGLDRPPIADRLAQIEGSISAKRKALARIPDLQAGGLFSMRIADDLRRHCHDEIEKTVSQLESLRRRELDFEQERRILFARCYGMEKTAYFEMFGMGHLSERAYRDLAFLIGQESESMRHGGRLPDARTFKRRRRRLRDRIIQLLDVTPGCRPLARYLRAERAARQYERTWGRYQACLRVLERLDQMARDEVERPEVVEAARVQYDQWRASARDRVDTLAEQFPEFVHAMQEELAERLIAHAEHEAIEARARAGLIPGGVAESMLRRIDEHLDRHRTRALSALRVEPTELLRKVPFFAATPEHEFARVAGLLIERPVPMGEDIVRQGEMGDSLFLIARGVVRVIRTEDGAARDVATLLAGDFFGEIAVLHNIRRTATCRAVTVCALYALRREDLDKVRAVCPAIQEALERAAGERGVGPV